ncbi:MAG: hypothetical protein ABH834_05885 [Candidatus Altiarchaeota archaeon]
MLLVKPRGIHNRGDNMERFGNTYLVSENGTVSITTSRWDAMFREIISRN